MPSFRKKKPEVPLQWHPNFRVLDALPDIKPVRTHFLVNYVIAAPLAIVAFAWLTMTEVDIFQVKNEAARYQDKMGDVGDRNSNASLNKKYLDLSKQFFTQSKRLQDLTSFYGLNISPLKVLQAIIAARPDNVLLDSVQIQPADVSVTVGTSVKRVKSQKIIVAGTMTGEADQLKELDTMVDKLADSSALKARFSGAPEDRTIETQRTGPGTFVFTISLNLKPPV